ncbi:MAG: dTDP-4-dehydrorhamnose 3,5-epimerase [Bacteroidales bacterium]|nr:dTDP-4-dehydrorhamnose 3,5-epimerase [Bacteroidales bacterium]
MKITKTPIKDLYVLEPRIFEDPRGYFFESYNKAKLAKSGINYNFIQDNQSRSVYGVIRGLHYQLEPKAQTKLVRVIQGKIYDVAVDVRKGSPTYGKWYGLELSEENKKQLIVPKGFAHGFSVLTETAIVMYKCDELYAPETDAGIICNDPELGIDWGIPEEKIIISEKDSKLPGIRNAKNNFKY